MIRVLYLLNFFDDLSELGCLSAVIKSLLNERKKCPNAVLYDLVLNAFSLAIIENMSNQSVDGSISSVSSLIGCLSKQQYKSIPDNSDKIPTNPYPSKLIYISGILPYMNIYLATTTKHK